MSPRAKNKFLEFEPVDPGAKCKKKNALKHGAYGDLERLPFEDKNQYNLHVRTYLNEYKAVGPLETDLVHEVANVIWCLRRLKLAKRALFSRRMADQSKHAFDLELIEDSGELVDEQRKVARAQHAVDEIEMLYLDARRTSIKQLLNPATPDMKIEWKNYRRRLGKTASLSDELINFLNNVYMPMIRQRFLDLTSTGPMRELAYGIALAPENGTAFERAEAHLDHRLKKLLTLFFGLQDRREKAATNRCPSEHGRGPSGNVAAPPAAATIESLAMEPR